MDKVTAAMVLTSLSTSPLVKSPPVKVNGECNPPHTHTHPGAQQPKAARRVSLMDASVPPQPRGDVELDELAPQAGLRFQRIRHKIQSSCSRVQPRQRIGGGTRVHPTCHKPLPEPESVLDATDRQMF